MNRPGPLLWILNGPSGSGKSTFAPQLLQDYLEKYGRPLLYFNPDERSLRQNTQTLTVLTEFYHHEIGTILNERRDALLETATPGLIAEQTAEKFKAAGYKVTSFSIVPLSLQQVLDNAVRRQNGGGQVVLPGKVQDYYEGCIARTPLFLTHCDEAKFFENNNTNFSEIVSMQPNTRTLMLHIDPKDITAARRPYLHALLESTRKNGYRILPANGTWMQAGAQP